MSTSTEDIIRRYAREAGKPSPKFLYSASLNVYVNSRYGTGRDYGAGSDTIYSYGSHFPMAVIMPDRVTGETRGWWLLNGDRYSPSTTRHQEALRSAIKGTGLPVLIIPFSALNPSGIDRSSITPIEILPDRWTWEPREREEPPAEWQVMDDSSFHGSTRAWQQRISDRKWLCEVSVHHLGESLFKADFSYTEYVPSYTDLTTMERVYPGYTPRKGSAYFLSAFDTNEPGQGLYFLAQLPEGASPPTVAEAFEALKPAEVHQSEYFAGPGSVLRQGDVFAVRSDRATRELPGPGKRSAYVLGVNHQVTEVRIDGMGNTYGRGVMRHKPQESGRRPEHRSVKLGDGKAWYLLVKNTVPAGRSWSVSGQVD